MSWLDDNMNSVVQGDCLEVMKSIPDGCIDMILADVPYGTTACSWDTVIPLEPMWEQIKRVIKTNGAIVMTASQPFTTKLIASNMKMFKYCWVWLKDRGAAFGISHKQPLRITEDVVVFYKIQPTYKSKGVKLSKEYRHALHVVKSNSGRCSTKNNINKDGSRKYSTYTHKTKNNVIYAHKDNAGHGTHPTQKPVKLMEYLIQTYTNKGDIVLDFTCGSGTTCVAAKNLNRRFIGIELEEKYCEIARQRLAQEVLAL